MAHIPEPAVFPTSPGFTRPFQEFGGGAGGGGGGVGTRAGLSGLLDLSPDELAKQILLAAGRGPTGSFPGDQPQTQRAIRGLQEAVFSGLLPASAAASAFAASPLSQIRSVTGTGEPEPDPLLRMLRYLSTTFAPTSDFTKPTGSFKVVEPPTSALTKERKEAEMQTRDRQNLEVLQKRLTKSRLR